VTSLLLIKSSCHAINALVSGFTVSDELADHRVIVSADLPTLFYVVVVVVMIVYIYNCVTK
jgi:hypothetical protein